jgi:hypothetical protein
MAYQTIKTTTRPTMQTPFFIYDEPIKSYINDAYNLTGKRVSVHVSDYDLEQVVTSVWKDEAAYNEFMADPRILLQGEAVNAHNAEHNITTTWNNSEV